MVSSINADAPEQGPDPLREYLQPKGRLTSTSLSARLRTRLSVRAH
jgi:hypothetical protein